jgi:tetratricopeptide (TPR) repeat protein
MLGVAVLALAPSAQAQQPAVRAESGGIAVGGSVSGSTISVGVTEEIRAALVRPYEELSDAQKKLIARLEEELELNKRQIRTALEILGENSIPPERLASKLVEIAERFKMLQASSLAQPGDDAKIATLKADAQKAIEAGDLARAGSLLTEVRTEQRRMRNRYAVGEAETSARLGDIALTRLRYVEAAQHFASAAAALPAEGAHHDKHIGYLQKEADALYRQGNEFGDNDALVITIARNRSLLKLGPRERAPLDWAMTQSELGNALASLGERESGTARLNEAVAAYREALKESTRERVPLDWARIRNNLGNALRLLGEREGGTARFNEAVEVFREALKEYTRERVPIGWALIQNNLGTALSALGARESGAARLNEAVAAYREALKERTRQRVPLDWASTQNNLANALAELGKRKNSTAQLNEAAAAYREALKELTRSACRCDGPRPRTISAMRWWRWASGRAVRRGSKRRSGPFARR